MKSPKQSKQVRLWAGVALVGLCLAGCHSRQTAAPLPPGVTPVNSNQPPPSMQALYQQSQAAKAQSGPSNAGAAGH